MKFTQEDVRRVAALANLHLNDLETSRLAQDLSDVLTHVEKLNELDVSGVEPMAQVLFEADPTATLRADVPHESLDNAAALANAPLSGAGHFKVHKIIER